jgi:hypothetical protein
MDVSIQIRSQVNRPVVYGMNGKDLSNTGLGSRFAFESLIMASWIKTETRKRIGWKPIT